MFEITGDDVAALNDVDLRTLVARLALAELQQAGLPRSSVTAGGNQDAADGGLDVRVSFQGPAKSADFIPRSETGFQVKKPDMNASAIKKEMKSRGKLRPVFAELAEKGGAYIIISAQGSTADLPLKNRKQAMRDALSTMVNNEQLFIDFYDRNRVATWVNAYPGVAAWVMGRVGRRLVGWSTIGEWTGAHVGKSDDYLTGDKTSVVDERTKEREEISLVEGIARIRVTLREPGACVRLIGLSGVGKSRLVEALFEDDVGSDPLDPGLAIYTDYSDRIEPAAREMARHLVCIRQRAFLVVDNCNPATHSQLAQICGAAGSLVSLLTVEYDVRDDEPEQTSVFRLHSASTELLSCWIAKSFPAISQVDSDRIGAMSDGNFKVASALAGTLKKGETLGQLKGQDLFARIFEQRSGPNLDLLRAAEELSLLYSYDGEDASENGELAKLASIRGVLVRQLFGASIELGRRRIVQARGRWRAVLPHAIANRLAASALERIPSVDIHLFSSGLSMRMFLSFSRRLGYLHDSPAAKAIVVQWLAPGGPLADLTALDEDGIAVLRNVAPVAPKEVLAKFSNLSLMPNSEKVFGSSTRNRADLITIVKALAFEKSMFDEAVSTLASFVREELLAGQASSAANSFQETFHLYLSGTQATIDQRIELVRLLANSLNEQFRRCGMIALEGLLEAGHFSSSNSFDFGARPRDFGWQPATLSEVQDWFAKAIALAVELRHIPEAKAVLARHIRTLWSLVTCNNELEAAATVLSDSGAWIDGWINFRATLRFDGKGMTEAIRSQLERIIDSLKPRRLIDQARAVVLGHYHAGYDFIDGDEVAEVAGAIGEVFQRAGKAAIEIGRNIAKSRVDLESILPEILTATQAPRAFQFGRGLASGSVDLHETWSCMKTFYSAALVESRNPEAIGGFLAEAKVGDPEFVMTSLEEAASDSSLVMVLPYLQARVGMDEVGVCRLRRIIAGGSVTSASFWTIANASIAGVQPPDLSRLLADISKLQDGNEVAIEMLHMYIFCNELSVGSLAPELISVGRQLLQVFRLRKRSRARDASLASIVRNCFGGTESESSALLICNDIRLGLSSGQISMYDFRQFLEAIFDTHPLVALDQILLGADGDRESQIAFAARLRNRIPINRVSLDFFQKWANFDPLYRYTILGKVLSIFVEENVGQTPSLSAVFQGLLDSAPDKLVFLGDYYSRLQPNGWSGSLADVLEQRLGLISPLSQHPDGAVRHWMAGMRVAVLEWIRADRKRDRSREQSFE